MAIHLSGGLIHAPPTATDLLRTRVVYRLAGVESYVNMTPYVYQWTTEEEMDRPVSVAKLQVVPSYLTADLEQTLVNGTRIKIYVGSPEPNELWFDGFITNTTRDGVSAVITAQSRGVEMERRTFTEDFTYQSPPIYSGRLVEIAKYIIETYTELDPQGVYFISTKQSDKLSYTDNTVLSAVAQIRDLLGWILYEKRGVVYLEPKGTNDRSITLTVGAAGQNGLKKLGSWESDQSRLSNTVTVNGKSETHSTVETFTGTGLVGQENVLAYPFFTNVKVETTADGGTTWVEKQGSLQGVTDSFDYTSYPEETTKKIKWNGTTGYIPPAAADNIKVTYSYPWQPTKTETDATSVAAYGTWDTTINRYDLLMQADVEEFAAQYLAIYKNPITRGKVVGRRRDLSVGEVVMVVDARNNINGQFTITKMEMQWPQYQLTMEVSTEGRHKMSSGDWRFGLIERVSKLENLNTGWYDIGV